MIDFEPTREADKDTTLNLMKKMLEPLGLTEQLERGRIAIVADAQLRNVAEELSGFRNRVFKVRLFLSRV